MLLTSYEFLGFLAVLLVLYYLVPRGFQWKLLLAASYLFYFVAGPLFPLYILVTTATTYLVSCRIEGIGRRQSVYLKENKGSLSKEEKKAYKQKNKTAQWRWMLACLLFNLGILAVVKYGNFAISNINGLVQALGGRGEFGLLGIIVPMGISFYTFQSMGYLIDVYREKVEPERNLAKLALFISFFPQIVQGPIGRFNTLAEQLFRPNEFSYTRVKFGVQLMLWGAFKKMVIADRVAVMVDNIFGFPETLGGCYVAVAALGYCIQIYGDFSGGIDIAAGAAQIFGIALDKNFERPYLATSIPDFWRRWHITLGAWFRDYVFYPLSLSKFFQKLGKAGRRVFGNYIGKLLPVLIPQFIIFFLIGIWHGAEWKYIAFGVYNGTLIVLGILFEQPLKNLAKRLGIRMECFSWRVFQVLRTLVLVALGKIITRAPGVSASVYMIRSMVENWDTNIFWEGGMLKLGLDAKDLWILFLSCCALLTVSLLQESGVKIRETLAKQNLYFRWAVYLGAVFSLVLFGVYGLNYDASDFIYRGF